MKKFIDHYNENVIQEKYNDKVKIEIECSAVCAWESLLPLIHYMKQTGSIGHSFSIIVDPDDSEYKKEFYLDGDGAGRIDDIKIDDKIYKPKK